MRELTVGSGSENAGKIASKKLLCSTGSSAQCSRCPRRVEWGCGMKGLKREGIDVYLELIHTVTRQKLL